MNRNNADNLIHIEGEMGKLADGYANQIGWGRDLKKFREVCLYCTRHCHYSRRPEVQQKFWDDVWNMLKEKGVNPEPIQKVLQEKLKNKPWDSTVAYGPEDVLKLISEQLDEIQPKQP